jgi:hypothetical protein
MIVGSRIHFISQKKIKLQAFFYRYLLAGTKNIPRKSDKRISFPSKCLGPTNSDRPLAEYCENINKLPEYSESQLCM